MNDITEDIVQDTDVLENSNSYLAVDRVEGMWKFIGDIISRWEEGSHKELKRQNYFPS